jgi:hypothetical protein
MSVSCSEARRTRRRSASLARQNVNPPRVALAKLAAYELGA